MDNLLAFLTLIRRIVIRPVVYSPVRLTFEQLRPVMLLATLSLFARKTLTLLILLCEKLLQFDWLRAVVFQLNLKYLHVKITNLLLVVV